MFLTSVFIIVKLWKVTEYLIQEMPCYQYCAQYEALQLTSLLACVMLICRITISISVSDWAVNGNQFSLNTELSNLDKYLWSLMLFAVVSLAQSSHRTEMRISAIVWLALTNPLLSFLPEVIVPDCHYENLQNGLIVYCTNLHSTR